MSSHQIKTDNDATLLKLKIDLRERLIQEKESYKILEAFAGDGVLWDSLKKKYPEKDLQILRIDQKPDKRGVYLKGNNIKFLASMDLSHFDIIDLDAYGSPFHQLQILFNKEYTGAVVCTFIQTMAGALNSGLLRELGYSPEMVRKCPSLFNINGLGKMKDYLGLKGVKKWLVYTRHRKNYFSFSMEFPKKSMEKFG
jgi:hypothetical protein